MSKLKDLHEGIGIMMKYVDPGKWIGGADHDIIWFVDNEDYELFSEEDKKRLDELGFHVDSDNGLSCFC
jgi:hypothetical protein